MRVKPQPTGPLYALIQPHVSAEGQGQAHSSCSNHQLRLLGTERLFISGGQRTLLQSAPQDRTEWRATLQLSFLPHILLIIGRVANSASRSAPKTQASKFHLHFPLFLLYFYYGQFTSSRSQMGWLYIFVWLDKPVRGILEGFFFFHTVKFRLPKYISQWALTNKIYFHSAFQ